MGIWPHNLWDEQALLPRLPPAGEVGGGAGGGEEEAFDVDAIPGSWRRGTSRLAGPSLVPQVLAPLLFQSGFCFSYIRRSLRYDALVKIPQHGPR